MYSLNIKSDCMKFITQKHKSLVLRQYVVTVFRSYVQNLFVLPLLSKQPDLIRFYLIVN